MKTKILYVILLLSISVIAQQPYYNDVDLTLTGQDLYFELQQKINIASSSYNYGDVKDSLKVTDEDPNNNNNVLLIYGYDDNGDCTTDRTRDKDDFGGSTCQYNREHVFSRSNANPPMGSVNNGTTGIGADPHNLRSSDQQMNGNRGNRKYANGSGNAGTVGSNWYPGDEWKGDVARMMMYMYTRYGDRCLPSLNGTGATEGSTNMLQLYLQWNIEDPVSEFEDQRNPYLENIYGNRNPFIDNPYLATLIWGGEPAEDRWEIAGVYDTYFTNLQVYPNPASNVIWVTTNSEFIPTTQISLYDILGRQVVLQTMDNSTTKLDVSYLNTGMYILKMQNSKGEISKKVLID
ncbi:MAG: endonuclease [Flavobacteriales bacterium]